MRRNKIITINKRSLTSTEIVTYTDSLMERLVSSTVPTSDTVATATVLDGFTIEQTDHQGGNWSFTRHYNATGILTTATDPRGITTSTQTDIAGRPIIQTDGEGNETTTTYTACCDQPASISDALGNVINYKYDIRNRKIAEYGTGIQPATYSYDSADRMTTLRTFRVDNSTITTDPTGRTDGDTTTWTYHDATGLQLSKTFADGTQETRSYNAFNQLATITNARGLTQTFAYNSQTAELASQNFASSPDRSFTYNHLGQLLSVSDESGNQQLSYNNYSDLLTESTSIANQSYSRTEQYDKVGRNIGYQLQRDGSTIHQNRYAYDNRGRIATAGFYHANNWQDFTYSYLQDTSILSTLEHPNGITSTRSYEPNRNLLTSIVDAKNGTTLSHKAYSYDAIARPTARTMNERSDSFAYNAKSELTAAQLGSDNYGYAYDNIGNRKTAQELAEEITYATNSTNEYTAINDFTPEFDADGNQTRLQTSTGIWTVEYNAENRPTKFTSEDGSTIVEARYDYMGRRAWKKVTINGNVNLHEAYIYRGYLQIAAIDLRGANAGHFITWDPTQPEATRPLALEKHGTWYTYGLDLSKNITELYTAEGTIATSYNYSPFGAVEASGNESTLNPIQWSSEIYDEELALVYYNYRSYNPADGRWINRDPIGMEGGMNLYGFVGNRVWIWDRLGLYVVLCFAYKEGAIIGKDKSDPSKQITIKDVFSGNNHANDPNYQHVKDVGPIPEGEYWLGNEYNRKPGHSGNYYWYKLYGDDGNGGKSYENVRVKNPSGETVTRGHFNLHTGVASDGCITVKSTVPKDTPKYPTSRDYDELRKFIKKGTNKPFKNPRKPSDTYSGIMLVKKCISDCEKELDNYINKNTN